MFSIGIYILQTGIGGAYAYHDIIYLVYLI